ncbi:MAG: hypothetical protein O3A00_22335 [Planctomycetota bacterium]|nr:hypothetical protein [Planctomycetota bacterium]
MEKITLKQDVISRLGNLQEPSEFHDEEGKVIGHFYPGPTRPLVSPLRDEELRRRAGEATVNTEAVLEHWDKLK